MDDKQFRILHLASSERWTGVADPVASLAAEQIRAGHRVWLACIPGQSFERKAAERGIPVLHQFHLDRRLHPGHMLSDLISIRRFVQQENVNVVHSHLLNDNWLAAMALINVKQPCLLVRTFHRCEPPRHDYFDRWLFVKRNDLTILTSKSLLSLFDSKVQLPDGTARVIYGGVDYERFHPDRNGEAVRRELGIAPDAPVAGFVARLTPGRGHRWLLDAVPEIARQLPEVRIVIAGRGALKKTLEAEIRSSPPLHDHVVMAGYRRHDLPETYAMLDVGLFLGMGSEGTCRAALEAMATGRPIIAPNAAAMPEIVEDGVTGLLVEKDNPQALADAVVRLLANPDERARMGQAARQSVLARFTEHHRGDATLEAYREAWEKKQKIL
jgi:glycosyltransferase involved in cell wall biosynthesis